MASESQFKFFQSLYDEEAQRTVDLRGTARNYLSLATFYSAFVLFVADKLKPDTGLTRVIFIVTIVCTVSAFLLSLLVIQISEFESVNDPKDIIKQYGADPMSDEEFFDNRIADYAVAYDRNSEINDRKARNLQFAGYALLLGIVLHACYFIIRVNISAGSA